MKMRLKKFSLYPKLYQRLKLKVQQSINFKVVLIQIKCLIFQQNGARMKSFILQLMATFLMYAATLKVHSQIRDDFWQLKAL